MTDHKTTPLTTPRAAAGSRIIFDVIGDPPAPPVIRPPQAGVQVPVRLENGDGSPGERIVLNVSVPEGDEPIARPRPPYAMDY